MPRIELGPGSDPHVPFRFRLGDRVKTQTGREGRIVGRRYNGPVATAGVVLICAISYTVHPERGSDFLALEVEWGRALGAGSPTR